MEALLGIRMDLKLSSEHRLFLFNGLLEGLISQSFFSQKTEPHSSPLTLKGLALRVITAKIQKASGEDFNKETRSAVEKIRSVIARNAKALSKYWRTIRHDPADAEHHREYGRCIEAENRRVTAEELAVAAKNRALKYEAQLGIPFDLVKEVDQEVEKGLIEAQNKETFEVQEIKIDEWLIILRAV